MIRKGIFAVGAYQIGKNVWQIVQQNTDLITSKNKPKINQSALITGASEGIGKAFAIQMAQSQKFSEINIVSRSQDKLDQVVSEIQDSKVNVQTSALDLSTASELEFQSLFKDRNYAVVISNAGCLDAGFFFEQDPQAIERQIKLNILAPVLLSKQTYLNFTNQHRETRPCMIHVSSILADNDGVFPSLAIYSGTKLFNQIFGKLLDHKSRKFKTCILKPSTVTTKLTNFRENERSVMPNDVAVDTLRNMDKQTRGLQFTYGANWHNIQGFILMRSLFWFSPLRNYFMSKFGFEQLPQYKKK